MGHKDTTLVWVDLEMTGLDPEKCAILEIAMILTDSDLKAIDKPLNIPIWQPDSVLETMEPFVRSMHEKSGLLPKIRSSDVSLEGAEIKVMEILTRHCRYRSSPLCGNSIGQDRRFLFKYMPQVEGYLHYRNIDVSTVKELALWWYDVKYVKPDTGKHTALHDIEQSIAELKHFREHAFKARS